MGLGSPPRRACVGRGRGRRGGWRADTCAGSRPRRCPDVVGGRRGCARRGRRNGGRCRARIGDRTSPRHVHRLRFLFGHCWDRRQRSGGRGRGVPRVDDRLGLLLGLGGGGLVGVASRFRVDRDDAQRAVEPRPVHLVHAGEADDDGTDTEGQRTDDALQEELSQARPPGGSPRVIADPTHAGQGHERTRTGAHKLEDHEGEPCESHHARHNVQRIERVQ